MDWKSLLGSVAPTLATALGGPVAGLATKALVGVLGLGEGAGEKEISKAIAGASPETLLALKKADQDFAVQMKTLDIDLERIAAGDRDSARKRESAVNDWTPKILAGVIVGGFLGTVYLVLAGYVEGLKDPMTATLTGTLIGYVSAKADQVVAYYFGSSASSRSKDATIASLSR
jgi:hypothetical protein